MGCTRMIVWAGSAVLAGVAGAAAGPVPLIAAPAAVPLLAGALFLLNAGRRERRGEDAPARRVARLAAEPAAIGLAWLPFASALVVLRTPAGAPPWTTLAAWGVAGAVTLLGGLAGKPRPAGGVAAGCLLLAALAWLSSPPWT